MDRYRKERDELDSHLKAIDESLQEYLASESHEWTSQRDDDRNKSMEERQAMRIQMESMMEELWKQFQKVIVVWRKVMVMVIGIG